MEPRVKDHPDGRPLLFWDHFLKSFPFIFPCNSQTNDHPSFKTISTRPFHSYILRNQLPTKDHPAFKTTFSKPFHSCFHRNQPLMKDHPTLKTFFFFQNLSVHISTETDPWLKTILLLRPLVQNLYVHILHRNQPLTRDRLSFQTIFVWFSGWS